MQYHDDGDTLALLKSGITNCWKCRVVAPDQTLLQVKPPFLLQSTTPWTGLVARSVVP